MGDYYESDRARSGSPTPAERMQADLDRAAAWGADRRAGLISDPGCESVAAWLDRQERADAGRLSHGQQVALFYEMLDDATRAVERRAE